MKVDWNINPEDLIPMPSLMRQQRDVTIQRILSRQEQEFKEVMDAHLPDGWTMHDLKTRCTLISVEGNPVQILYLDGKPVLEIHPIEFGEFERRSDRYTRTITQKFRRL